MTRRDKRKAEARFARKFPKIAEREKAIRREHAALAEFGKAASDEYMASRKRKSFINEYLQKRAGDRVNALFDTLPDKLKTRAFEKASTAELAYDAADAAFDLAIDVPTPVNRGALALAIAVAQEFHAPEVLSPLHAALDPKAMKRENAALVEFGAAVSNVYTAKSSTYKANAVKKVDALYKRLPRTLKTEIGEKASTIRSAFIAVDAADSENKRKPSDVTRGKLALAMHVASEHHGHDAHWPQFYDAFGSNDAPSRRQSRLGDHENRKQFQLPREKLQGIRRYVTIEFSKIKLNILSRLPFDSAKEKEFRRVIELLNKWGNSELVKIGKTATEQQIAQDAYTDRRDRMQNANLRRTNRRLENLCNELPEQLIDGARRSASNPEKARKAVLAAFKRATKYPADVHRGELVVALFAAAEIEELDFAEELDLANAFNPNDSTSQSRQQNKERSRAQRTSGQTRPTNDGPTSVTPPPPVRHTSSLAQAQQPQQLRTQESGSLRRSPPNKENQQPSLQVTTRREPSSPPPSTYNKTNPYSRTR